MSVNPMFSTLSMSRLRRLLMDFFGRGPNHGPWEEPFSGVRVPRGPAPPGRNAAAAVTEPEPDALVTAVGRVQQDRPR
jgi:hypothetical protein